MKTCTICGGKHQAKNLCGKHYTELKRRLNGNLPHPTLHMTMKEKLNHYSALNQATGCILWVGRISKGYGRMKVEGKSVSAHRVSWQTHNGEIPSGLWVLHKCDTPLCINPSHLFLGTCIENIIDRDTKGRQIRGEHHIQSKLTELQVIAIRNDARNNCAVALDYGVSNTTVSRIRLLQLWKHI